MFKPNPRCSLYQSNPRGCPYSRPSSPLLSTTSSATYPAMADTGCQSCLTGTKLLSRLGLVRKHLTPVAMKMTATNNRRIDIADALALRISSTSPSGETLETRQIVYFTDSSDRLFLSKQACVALSMISHRFPTTGKAAMPNCACVRSSATPASCITPMCECPRRQVPPPPPTSLPFPATEENREKMEKWLLDYYKSSTFNMCEHQPLHMMDGPQLRLMVEPDAWPVAHHAPIPVPVHWQDDMKACLNRDIRLGVIEPVPIGKPVTWCQKIVPERLASYSTTVRLEYTNRLRIQ